ncbi:MAG: hypothetical protein IPL52_15220 [Flavobacteriales bacterium]|nr:hypothetical protein [Flavobacteriales bacterium]
MPRHEANVSKRRLVVRDAHDQWQRSRAGTGCNAARSARRPVMAYWKPFMKNWHA